MTGETRDPLGPAAATASYGVPVSAGRRARTQVAPTAAAPDDADEWSESDAVRVVDLIARGNAERVYALG